MPDFLLFVGLVSAGVTCIGAAIAERRDKDQRRRPGRVEEILEVTEIVDDAADRLVSVLERSGAGRYHDPQALREMAHDALDSATVDVARRAFGTPAE